MIFLSISSSAGKHEKYANMYMAIFKIKSKWVQLGWATEGDFISVSSWDVFRAASANTGHAQDKGKILWRNLS